MHFVAPHRCVQGTGPSQLFWIPQCSGYVLNCRVDLFWSCGNSTCVALRRLVHIEKNSEPVHFLVHLTLSFCVCCLHPSRLGSRHKCAAQLWCEPEQNANEAVPRFGRRWNRRAYVQEPPALCRAPAPDRGGLRGFRALRRRRG